MPERVATYTVTIDKIPYNGSTLFKARVAEMPDLVDFGDTHAEALELIVDSITTYINRKQPRR